MSFVGFIAQRLAGAAGYPLTGLLGGLVSSTSVTLTMTRSVATGTALDLACRAILMGVVANSLMKAGIAIVIGERRFGWQTGASLLAMAAAGAVMLAW